MLRKHHIHTITRPLWTPVAIIVVLLFVIPAAASAPLVSWVSEKHEMGPDSLGAFGPVVSEDGQVVAFTTPDSSFVDEPPWPDCSGDRPGLHLPCSQVVVKSPTDTCRASQQFNGGPLEVKASFSSMDGSGKVVAFASHDPHVVQNDNNGIGDAFVVRGCGQDPIRVTVSSDGEEAEPYEDDREEAGHPCRYYCPRPQVSPDGGTIAYQTWSANLDLPDSNGWPDVFVHDLQSATTAAISRTPAGETANGPSYLSSWAGKSLSADGSRVVFISFATNLVEDDIPSCPADYGRVPASYELDSCNEAYLYDHEGIRLISKTENGMVSPGGITELTISGNGEYAFFSTNSQAFLESVGHDSVPGLHIYRKHLSSGEVELVALTPNGTAAQGNHQSFTASHDGQRVAFMSDASDLVPRDTNEHPDIFVRDMNLNQTWRASVTENGQPITGELAHPGITLDGRSLIFLSRADGIVAEDTNGITDIFLVNLARLQEHPATSRTEGPGDQDIDALGLVAVLVILATCSALFSRRKGM